MTLKKQLIDALPPFRGEKVLVKKHQGTNDIIKEICEAHCFFTGDYDCIYEFFDTGDIYSTCKKIWDFEKQNMHYDAESGKEQSSKSPAAILQTPVDCKHYALFASGILEAIKENNNVPWNWFYRFASDKDVNDVTHVFVVVTDKKKEIWIDPCLSVFDQRKNYLITKDEKPMPLYRISGINDVAPAQKTVVVDKQKALTGFLIILSKNLFPAVSGGVSLMKQLMQNYPDVTNGAVKDYFVNNGFDWNEVQKFIYS